MKVSLCVVNRMPLFYHIQPNFVICLCILSDGGNHAPTSTLALWGKATGKWVMGHSVSSHKEKLNTVFP